MRDRAGEEADDPRIGRVLHIHDVARVKWLAAVRFEGFGYRDNEILKQRIILR